MVTVTSRKFHLFLRYCDKRDILFEWASDREVEDVVMERVNSDEVKQRKKSVKLELHGKSPLEEPEVLLPKTYRG